MAEAPAAAACGAPPAFRLEGPVAKLETLQGKRPEHRVADAADDAAGSASPADEAPVAAERREVSRPDEGSLARPIHDPSTYELLATYLFLHGAQEGQRRLPDGDHGKEIPQLRAPVRV